MLQANTQDLPPDLHIGGAGVSQDLQEPQVPAVLHSARLVLDVPPGLGAPPVVSPEHHALIVAAVTSCTSCIFWAETYS